MKTCALLTLSLTFSMAMYAQHSSNDRLIEWTTWMLLRCVPSPTLIEDGNGSASSRKFVLRWEVTAINYSFNANSLVSRWSSLKVNPIRRYGGSIELFGQPTWALSDFDYADMNRFSLKSGIRGYLPIDEYGEYLSLSSAALLRFSTTKKDERATSSGIELGLYSFFGIVGVQYSYYFGSENRYDIAFTLRYY